MLLAVLIGMAIVACIPLGIGAAISRGSRSREVGIVLVVCASFTAFTTAMMAYMILAPDLREILPRFPAGTAKGVPLGIANLAVFAFVGYTFLKRAPKV